MNLCGYFGFLGCYINIGSVWFHFSSVSNTATPAGISMLSKLFKLMPNIQYPGDNMSSTVGGDNDENNSFTEDYDEQFDSGVVSIDRYRLDRNRFFSPVFVSLCVRIQVLMFLCRLDIFQMKNRWCFMRLNNTNKKMKEQS